MTYPKYCYYKNGELRPQYLIELAEKLNNIWDDFEFILGVLNDVDHIDDCAELTEYIDNHKDITSSDVIKKSVELADKRGDYEYITVED